MTDPHSFHTTRWSLISRVRLGDDAPAAQDALAELCRQCWYPVYAFVRRSGAQAQDAEDSTQGFFQHLLTHDLLQQARREQGRFRSYLLACLKHYLGNEWQRKSAQRRGGHLVAVQMDALTADERYRLEAESLSTDTDLVFDQQWATEVLEQAMQGLRAEHSEPEDAQRLESLLPALMGTPDRVALMQATGLSEGALKVALHRLRRRYRECLRRVVRQTVDSEAEVDAELDYLVACLRR